MDSAKATASPAEVVVKRSRKRPAARAPKARRRTAVDSRTPRADSRAVAGQGPTTRSLFTLVVQIGGVVSAAAAAVGLVFLLAPGLKPDPPPTERGASFSKLTTEPNVSRADYLRRLDRARGSYRRDELRRPGVIIGFNVEITGHNRERLPLRWGVYRASDAHQLYREKATTLMPEARVDQASSQLWTPLPRGRGPFYVLLQLFEEDGLVAIDQARSATFTGRGGTT